MVNMDVKCFWLFPENVGKFEKCLPFPDLSRGGAMRNRDRDLQQSKHDKRAYGRQR